MSKSEDNHRTDKDAAWAKLTGTAGHTGPTEDKPDTTNTGGIPLSAIREARRQGKKQ